MVTLTRTARSSSGNKVVRLKKASGVKVPAWRAVVVVESSDDTDSSSEPGDATIRRAQKPKSDRAKQRKSGKGKAEARKVKVKAVE